MDRLFVTFDIAKKLKDKGYPQKFRGEYECFGPCYFSDGRFYDRGAIAEVDELFTAPTYHEVFEWLREEKGVYVSIETFPTFSTKDKVHFCYKIKTESDGSNMKVIESEYTYGEYVEAEKECVECVLVDVL